MTALKLGNPIPYWNDARGLLLDGGSIYVGVANDDPETNPITVYSDVALTVPVTQPINTVGGFATNETGIPILLFVAETNFSMTTRDNTGALVSYSPETYVDTSAFQPASATLDLLAALTTTAFGRSLLEMANIGVLITALGGLNYVPLAGTSLISGEMIHTGAGPEFYWSDAALGSAKVFPTVNGAGDPTSAPGHIWFEETP